MQDVNQLLIDASAEITSADSLATLESIKVKYLGKKGFFSDLMTSLKDVSADEKPKFGQIINSAKTKIQHALEQKRAELEAALLQDKLLANRIDVTLPGRGQGIGSLHVVTLVEERVVNIFKAMGFIKGSGPEIEDDFHNFAALNFGPMHPARDMQDTFYLRDGYLLRTHTSTVQIRTLSNTTPPIRMIASGRVYRCDSDLTHTPMFHQLEGFMVDEDTSFANLKYTLHSFLELFFAKKLKTRLRSSYFPFTEPSAEMDMECANCDGAGCKICSHTGWLEILGCGMIHPNVLKNCNIDADKYRGWAFGIGLDRLAMLYYKIPDLRLLFENDIRFLSQF